MNIKGLIFSALILISHVTWSQIPGTRIQNDSFFLETDPSNRLYLNYKVSKKQTLYSISKTFQIDLDSLFYLNPELKTTGLHENAILKVPVNKSSISSNELESPKSGILLLYKIKTGESLYHLSKRKFDLNLSNLLKYNNLKTSAVHEGSILKLGYLPILDSPKEKEVPDNNHQSADTENTIVEFEPFTKQSRGVAVSEYDQLGSGRLFALHNTAKMDSQIEIENPVLNRKVYAKVIGRIPPIYEHDVQIIVSAETARLLGAVDKRFFVSIKYR